MITPENDARVALGIFGLWYMGLGQLTEEQHTRVLCLWAGTRANAHTAGILSDIAKLPGSGISIDVHRVLEVAFGFTQERAEAAIQYCLDEGWVQYCHSDEVVHA